jgi:predicted ATPase/class 3 adenylate cyclase/DNA-binding CsgD family transcriptional regulator
MFLLVRPHMLVSMSEIDWSDAGVSDLLPTGTVTLLLADVEGSTRLWETRPDEMTAALARLDQTISDAIATHDGIRPVEQGEGDSFVIAFARASDAVACALQLQRAPLAPIRLRIGLHTGEVQLRDEGNYMGPTINRTARLRDLAHGGQTVLSGTAGDLVLDRLPEHAQLIDLGSHPLRDLPRPERVLQLCHPELPAEFPPLRIPNIHAAQSLPSQLTNFVGRADELAQVTSILAENRLVTLTGAGGVGKTRLAIEVATRIGAEFDGGTWYVDLAPITDADVVPIAVVRALGLVDQLGAHTMHMLSGFIGKRRMLLVLDNCEHLLDSSAALVTALTGSCPRLTLLATSREPIGASGEATWRVPSLPLADDAIELFADRARLTRPEFRLSVDNTGVVSDICRRLDGMPLAIELAAARVRALTLTEIRDGLHDRFRLLTGGARGAVRRQQTLWASVDWSHALLTEAERVLFRRLAVFMGGFDLEAARSVAGGADIEPHQVLDQLTLLVDKSLVMAEDGHGRMRYRMLETVRQFAQERLSESGESQQVRTAHRDYYTGKAAMLDRPGQDPDRWPISRAERDIDNLRAAFDWSRDDGDVEAALRLVSALWPLWVGRGRLREARNWFESALGAEEARYPGIDGATWSRALADKVMLEGMSHTQDSLEDARQALAIAREIGDPALVGRALTACASTAAFNPDAARPYGDEAIEMARAADDRGWLCQVLAWRCAGAYYAGDPITARVAGAEGRDLADATGDRFVSRSCRWALGWAEMLSGDVAAAAAQLLEVATEADADGDAIWSFTGLFNAVDALARLGDNDAAYATADTAETVGDELGGNYRHYSQLAVAMATLAAGDVAATKKATDSVWRALPRDHAMSTMGLWRRAAIALAGGDVTEARHWADVAVAETMGWHLANALGVRARVAIAQGDSYQAEQDAHQALVLADQLGAQLAVPDVLECLASVVGDEPLAARLFGAADAVRQRTGEVRFHIYQAAYQTSVAALRNAMSDQAFDGAWTEGAGLSTAEAIAYAQRGRGERKRPASGWASVTPAEHEVIRLVCEGLANKDIATRLFVSPRTVQAHLTHVYAKLDITSRAQLIQLVAHRH